METKRIVNVSKNTVVAERAEMATTFIARLRGLLGRKGLPEGGGLVLQPTDMIHTFFMAFPIDVLFLDGDRRVLHVIEGMGRNRISPWVRHSRSVVEVPAGTIARTRTGPGDVLVL